jgi:hypothetical protein
MLEEQQIQEPMSMNIPDLIQVIPSTTSSTELPKYTPIEQTQTSSNVNNEENKTDGGNVGDVVIADSPEIDYDTYFVQPEKFENIDQEIAWYRERFDVLSKEINPNTETIRELSKPYVDEYIQQQETEIQGFAEMKRALDTNPRAFLMQYIPEALAELGISPIMTDNEILDNIAKDMATEFGDDYRERFNHNDVIDPRTESSQMWLRMDKLKSEYNNLNNRNREILEQWNSKVINNEVKTPSNEEAMQFIESSYKEQFEPLEIPKEEFNATIEWAKQAPPITTLDIYKLKNFEVLLQEAYNSGIVEGKQVTYKNTAARGGQEVVASEPQKQVTVTNPNATSDLIRMMQQGGIPAF